MEKEVLINTIQKATRASVEMEEENQTDSCGKYTIVDFFSHCYGLLNKTESEALDSHCLECPLCRSGLATVKQIIEEPDEKESAQDCEMLLQAAQEYMEQQEANIEWAAKGEQPGFNGEALGIAISEEEDKAIIITLKTYIDKKLDDDAGLYIIGDRRGLEHAPIDDHEERLKTLFMSIPHLRAFNLHRRYVSIDTGEIYLKKTLSISLAIVISLINALYKLEDVPMTIYSALVNPDGTLDPIKGIAKKLSAAKENGARRFILSSENRCDVPAELLNDQGFEILFFDNLDQVISFLGVPSFCA